jgi:hypothetical protein
VNGDITIRPWWGSFVLQPGMTRHHTLGPLELWIERRVGEVRVAWSSRGEPLAYDFAIDENADPPSESLDLVVQRFGLPDGPTDFSLVPLLADRDMVVSPQELISVLPGCTVTLYISSPVWFELGLRDPAVPLVEAPTYRPSDTWFGPNTRQGDLCYWSRVRARLDRGNLPLRAQRAATALTISNLASTPFPVDRLRLPLPLLSLFATQEGRLWTDTVCVTRHADGTTVDLDFAGAPDDPGAARVRGPRRTVERHMFNRLEGLFAPLGGRRHGRMGRLPWS